MKRKNLFCSIALTLTMFGGLIGQVPMTLAAEETGVTYAQVASGTAASAPSSTASSTPAGFAASSSTPVAEKEPTFEDFVERLYVVALNRASEKEGKKYWVSQVSSGAYNGADCARFFLLEAPEFMQRKLSIEDFVETLYKTFFDRESDAAGKKGWTDAIRSGKKSRAEVVNDFIESTEWCNVCASYSVKSGAKWHKATVPSKKAVEFATRLYTCCLKRDPEENGLKYWALALTNLEQTGCSAAKLFFDSKELHAIGISDGEYVKKLYLTFMGREPSKEERKYWVHQLLYTMTTRSEVLRFFGNSEEFAKICASYGINQGAMS